MTVDRLTLKEMCAKFNVTTRTLRYYEYIELLFPEKEGRTRFYGPTEFARMELILRGKRWGFSLEEIRQWLEMYDKEDNSAQLETLLEMAERQLVALESQYEQLGETLVDLKEMRNRTLDRIKNIK
ncbi:MerR family DNA-binding transcriptional regulator [Amylibacter sp. IMCC11727]|uniref:MerR family transcriptional regulator n=1 Tax=Amylibacter sp. IMCC11727 TaxID=3039851 RepID=UPI00244DA6BA|nr:MerR family DNA-binding transcriptional regulator [Amylibacter sp. IMCC11727]WGI22716.1 MerR family DNA-binding transcriptional regulator [Amylibacter sp. IMCC11727]